MAQTVEGAQKAMANRIGLSVDEYAARLANGEKWCSACRTWHPRGAFPRDRGRKDGLMSRCRAARKREYDATYKPVPPERRKPMGPSPAPARAGDVRQARARVNVLVRTGHLARPNDVSCVDCGHVWSPGERRHEYDHYLGYGSEHHLDVEAVCTLCHAARDKARGLRR